MELVIEVTSDERHMLGQNARKSFKAVGGVIGRHPDCEWSIPDQKRHLSSRHALVTCEQNGFHITDISTNGVFLNGEEMPLGRERTIKLNDADRLSMGNIEFVVRLQLDATQIPFKSQSAAGQPFNKQPKTSYNNPVDPIALFKSVNGVELGGSNAAPETVIMPLSQSEQVVSAPDHRPGENTAFVPPAMLPENWHEEPSDIANPPTANSHADAVANPADSFEPVLPKPGIKSPSPSPGIAPKQRVKTASAHSVLEDSVLEHSVLEHGVLEDSTDKPQRLLNHFFKGLGVSPNILDKVNAEQVMEEMGACLKANMQGMVQLMQQRASLKNEFRMDMTLVKSEGNNPLKFSADSKQALKHLFKPEGGSFLAMSDSFAECYNDLSLHQVALLAGVQAAIREMFTALSPANIEDRVQQERKGIAMASKSSRCWHKYRLLHDDIKSEDDRFNRLFGDAFVSAYDDQVERMKTAAFAQNNTQNSTQNNAENGQ